MNYLLHGPGSSFSDWDGDGVKNHLDPAPLVYGDGGSSNNSGGNNGWTDDPNNPDDDGDTYNDDIDTDPGNSSLWRDFDHDGSNDPGDGNDSDGDGVSNDSDLAYVQPCVVERLRQRWLQHRRRAATHEWQFVVGLGS